MFNFLSKVRTYWLKQKLLEKIGNNFQIIEPKLINCLKKNISIGDDFFAGSSLYISINKYCNLNIGNAVMFGPEVMILGGNHSYEHCNSHLRYYSIDDVNTKAIKIGDGVWVGARVTILSGAEIGEGAIIGTGAVVNKYLPPYTIAVGIPAKVIKCRFENQDKLIKILKNTSSKYSHNDIIEIYDEYNIQHNYTKE